MTYNLFYSFIGDNMTEQYGIKSSTIIKLAQYEKECIKYAKDYLKSGDIADLVMYKISCIYLNNELIWVDAPIYIKSTPEEEECDILIRNPLIKKAMDKYLEDNNLYWP